MFIIEKSKLAPIKIIAKLNKYFSEKAIPGLNDVSGLYKTFIIKPKKIEITIASIYIKLDKNFDSKTVRATKNRPLKFN